MSNDTEAELQRSVGRIEGKMDSFIEEMRASHSSLSTHLTSHGKRIGALERWRTAIAGGFAVVAVAVKYYFSSK